MRYYQVHRPLRASSEPVVGAAYTLVSAPSINLTCMGNALEAESSLTRPPAGRCLSTHLAEEDQGIIAKAVAETG